VAPRPHKTGRQRGLRAFRGHGWDRGSWVGATLVKSVLARGYAFVVVGLRYLIVGAWGAAVALGILFLPPLSATSSGGLSDLIPPGVGRHPRGRRRGPAVRLPHRRGRGDRAARPARDAGGGQGPRDPPGHRRGPAAVRAAHGLARAGRSGAGESRPARRRPDPERPGQPGAAGRDRRPGRGVPAAQRGRPAARDAREVHHGHHVPGLPAGHLVWSADRWRERLRPLADRATTWSG